MLFSGLIFALFSILISLDARFVIDSILSCDILLLEKSFLAQRALGVLMLKKEEKGEKENAKKRGRKSEWTGEGLFLSSPE
jgi:hypothetical protein